jgi:hypothetical protein
MLSVILLNAIVLGVKKFIMLCIVLIVIMLNAIMLSVVALQQ